MGFKVLLVDDIQFILEFEEKVIASLAEEMKVPIDVDKVGSIAEAKELLEKNRYDAAIVDMNLPDGSGSEVAEIIREKSLPTRIAALTIYPEEYEAQQEMFDAYFKKPILPNLYKKNLRILLEK